MSRCVIGGLGHNEPSSVVRVAQGGRLTYANGLRGLALYGMGQAGVITMTECSRHKKRGGPKGPPDLFLPMIVKVAIPYLCPFCRIDSRHQKLSFFCIQIWQSLLD